jgi:hypothetical protein
MRTITWVCLLVLSIALACSNDRVETPITPPSVDRPDAISLNREAEEAALWLSGELTAPSPLFGTILADLAAIRSAYSPAIPILNHLEFIAWWPVSKIGVVVTAGLRDKVVAGEPNALDSLNTGYHGTGTSRFSPVPLGWMTEIHFAGRQHPERLAEIYRTVAGVTQAFPDSWIGDYSNVYPWHVEGGMSYLFRLGLGDCPAGCEASDFYYFRRVAGVTEYVGTFRMGVDPYPAWWSEGKAAFCAFMVEQWGWSSCPW